MDKKGISPNILLVFFVFFFFFAVIFLGIVLFITTQVDSAFSSIDLQVGVVSFNETYNQTLFQAFQTIEQTSDTLGLMLLFGMAILMVIIGFFSTANRMWIIYDIIIMIVSFILAVELSKGFNTYINSIDEINLIHADIIPQTSSLLLNLPFMVVVVGALVGIVTYGITRKKSIPPRVMEGF